MKDYYNIKKDLQKVIGQIRKEGGDRFPKAMMTSQQMNKDTATVNCGGEWRRDSAAVADEVMHDPRFAAFLAKYDARAFIEKNPFGGVQVRIHY